MCQHDCETRQDKISRLKNQLAILKLGQNEDRELSILNRIYFLEKDLLDTSVEAPLDTSETLIHF